MTYFFGNQKDYSFQPPDCVTAGDRKNYDIEPYPKNEYWPNWGPGVYNAFSDGFVHAPNILACPEMMCGAPDLVKATISNFESSIVLPENFSTYGFCIDEYIHTQSISNGDEILPPHDFLVFEINNNWLYPSTRFNGGIPKWNKDKTCSAPDEFYVSGVPYYAIFAGTSVDAPETIRVEKRYHAEYWHDCMQKLLGASSGPKLYNDGFKRIPLSQWESICGAGTVVWPNLSTDSNWPKFNNKQVWLEENSGISPIPTFYSPYCLAGAGFGADFWQFGPYPDCELIMNIGSPPPPPHVNTGLYPVPYDFYGCTPDPNVMGATNKGLPWAEYGPAAGGDTIIYVYIPSQGIGVDGALNKIIGFSDIPGFYNEGTLQYDIIPINNGWRNQYVCGLKWKDIVQSSPIKNSGLQILKKVLNKPIGPIKTVGLPGIGSLPFSNFWYDEDLNGSYKCYRDTVYFRPELIPHITRNINSFPTGYSNVRYPKEWDAELLFEIIGKPVFKNRMANHCRDYNFGRDYQLLEYKTEPTPQSSIGTEDNDSSMTKIVNKFTGDILDIQLNLPYNFASNAAVNHNAFRIIGGSGSASNVGKEDTFLGGSYNSSSYWFDNREAFTSNGFLCVDYRTSPRRINSGGEFNPQPGFLETCFIPAGNLSDRGPDKPIGKSDRLNHTIPCAANMPSAPLGTVKPHLAFRAPNSDLYNAGIYSEGPQPSGNGANLFPILKPSKYINNFIEIDELSQYPTFGPPGRSRLDSRYNVGEDTHAYSWILDKVKILDGGSGYAVGNVFVLDYDPNKFFLPYINGQSILVFPDDECCYEISNLGSDGNQRLTWSDTGGYTKVQRLKLSGSTCGGGAPVYVGPYKYVYQRIRVSEVDENGKILSVEVLPWRKSLSFPPICEELIKTAGKDYYVEYTRFLCHPRSVTYGGKYYNIGDIIQWKCDESIDNCEVWQNNYASGIVVDVDENGSILDWHINGSEITKWDNGFTDDPTLTTDYTARNIVDGTPCYGWTYTLPNLDAPTPNPRNEPTGIEPDERGSYRFMGQNLCQLSWKGVGVPVRTTTWENERLGIGANGVDVQTSVNSSNITNININITRQYCETTADIFVKNWSYSYETLSYSEGEPEFSGFIKNNKEYASINNKWYSFNFAPYPKCNGGGAEIELIYGSPQANDSIYGSTIKSANVISGGSLYAFVDKVHEPPILPTGVELIAGGGRGASIASFTFDNSINNFPNLNYITYINSLLPFTLNPKRFAYFPVTSATLLTAGSGYEVDQYFIIEPDDVATYSAPWSKDGGDNPDFVINGGKYTGYFNKLVKDSKYMPDIDCTMGIDPPFDLTPSCQEIEEVVSPCMLKVATVGSSGEITSLSVEHGGMMYRPVWTSGLKNPDAIPEIVSTLGYGAKPSIIVNTDKNSNLFGKVTSFSIAQYTAQEFPDPYYTGLPRAAIPGNNSIGYGRDYANPSLGSFWMLQDISDIGGRISTNYKLLAHYDYGINYKGIRNDVNVGYYSPSPLSPETDYQTHSVMAGSKPSFVPKSTVCSFNNCYHDLLNKTYPLYRQTFPSINPTAWSVSTTHVKLEANSEEYEGIYGKYILIEHGFELTLESDKPPDKSIEKFPNPSGGHGRTFSTPINGIYDVYTYR